MKTIAFMLNSNGDEETHPGYSDVVLTDADVRLLVLEIPVRPFHQFIGIAPGLVLTDGRSFRTLLFWLYLNS